MRDHPLHGVTILGSGWGCKLFKKDSKQNKNKNLKQNENENLKQNQNENFKQNQNENLEENEIRKEWKRTWKEAAKDETFWADRNLNGPDQDFLQTFVLKELQFGLLSITLRH